MIYWGPDFLALVWFGSMPTRHLPSASCLSFLVFLPSSLLARKGGVWSKKAWPSISRSILDRNNHVEEIHGHFRQAHLITVDCGKILLCPKRRTDFFQQVKIRVKIHCSSCVLLSSGFSRRHATGTLRRSKAALGGGREGWGILFRHEKYFYIDGPQVPSSNLR